MASNKLCLGLSVQSGVVGFAVYSRRAGLVDWGTICCRYGRGERVPAKVEHLIERYTPARLNIDDHRPRSFRRGAIAKARIKKIIRLARKHKISIQQFSALDVKHRYRAENRFTRYQIALLMTDIHPVLLDRLPRPRKIWQSEPRGMSMFMAVALATAD